MVPECEHPFEGFIYCLDAAKAPIHGARGLNCFGFAQQKDHFARFAGLKFDRSLDRRAGIKSRAVIAAQSGASQSRRLRQRAVAPDELLTIAGHRERTFAGAGESDALGKLVIVRVAREDRAFVFFHVGYDMGGGSLAGNAQQ